MFKNLLLPWPWKTNCRDYRADTPFVTRGHCINICQLNETIRQLRRVPFTAIVGQSDTWAAALPHTSLADLQNSTFVELQESIERLCHARCIRPDCVEQLVITRYFRSEIHEHLKFRLYAPSSPAIGTYFYASLTVTEFLVYLLSCFGIWFSICAMDASKLIDVVLVGLCLVRSKMVKRDLRRRRRR